MSDEIRKCPKCGEKMIYYPGRRSFGKTGKYICNCKDSGKKSECSKCNLEKGCPYSYEKTKDRDYFSGCHDFEPEDSGGDDKCAINCNGANEECEPCPINEKPLESSNERLDDVIRQEQDRYKDMYGEDWRIAYDSEKQPEPKHATCVECKYYPLKNHFSPLNRCNQCEHNELFEPKESSENDKVVEPMLDLWEKNTITVTCPHCHKGYYLAPKKIEERVRGATRKELIAEFVDRLKNYNYMTEKELKILIGEYEARNK